MTIRIFAALSAIALAGLPLAGRAQTASAVDTLTLTATVESLDMSTRQALLRGDDGNLVTVHVGPNARNLGQVKPGDRVTARYRQAMIATILPPGTADVEPSTLTSGARAPLGAMPGGIAEDAVRMQVAVTAVDPARNTVSVIGPSKVPQTFTVRDPRMQALLPKLNVGDRVAVTYGVSLAVDVERAAN